MIHERDSNTVQETIKVRIEDWIGFNNKLFGFVGLALAFTSLGMSDPRFFATCSLLFIFSAWLPTAKKTKRFLKFCRDTKHPEFGIIKILIMGMPYVIGFTALLLVAFGLFTKDATFTNMLPGLNY